MFYFGTHEIGIQKRSSLTPFAAYRDKYALYRGRCPQSLLEGTISLHSILNILVLSLLCH